MEFSADQIEFSAADGVARAAFKAAAESYLILSRTLAPDEQDTKLGMDQIHIELNDQKNSTYGGVAIGSFNSSRLEFCLNNRSSGNVGVTKIAVQFNLTSERLFKLREVIAVLFQGAPNFTIAS
jgi:hypothetical protein